MIDQTLMQLLACIIAGVMPIATAFNICDVDIVFSVCDEKKTFYRCRILNFVTVLFVLTRSNPVCLIFFMDTTLHDIHLK